MNVAELEQFSILSIWTAVVLYALAFLVYAWDISKRAELAVARQDARERTLVSAGGAEIPAPRGSAPVAAPAEGELTRSDRNVMARIATSLMWLAFVFHLGATVLRGVAAGRVPWSNMYEFAMTGTLLMTAVYLIVLFKYDLRYIGAFISGLITLLMASAATFFYVEIVPLSDPLKSPWLVIHVFVATAAVAFFALACSLSVLQLMQMRREAKRTAGAEMKKSFLDTIPNADKLESLAYRFTIIGFILWTFTLIAGSIWANDAWGRYWGFDTKEVWTFVIWVLYAGYIHARATRGWRGARSAWLSIVGFAAVLFNFTIVNVFFKGLHTYSGLYT